MYIDQEKSNVDLDKPCDAHPSGFHKWQFLPSAMHCGNCKWTIPIARLICEHCKGVNRFFRADLVPNPLGLVDVFRCEHCGENSSIAGSEVQ